MATVQSRFLRKQFYRENYSQLRQTFEDAEIWGGHLRHLRLCQLHLHNGQAQAFAGIQFSRLEQLDLLGLNDSIARIVIEPELTIELVQAPLRLTVSVDEYV